MELSVKCILIFMVLSGSHSINDFIENKTEYVETSSSMKKLLPSYYLISFP